MVAVARVLFAIDVVILLLLIVGTLWSIAFPVRRIWPPPNRHSWQYFTTWACFYTVFLLNAILFVLDWNTWLFPGLGRFIVGISLVAAGTALVTWGVATLGMSNTSGERAGLVLSGPYRATRNPQYLADVLLFVGLSVIVNSRLVWITHGLLMVVLLLAPFAEEPWLEAQYGDAYREYRRATPRYLGLKRPGSGIRL